MADSAARGAGNGTSACPRCFSPVPPGARFCSFCGSAVAATPPSSALERRHVVVLFCDMVGYSHLSTLLDPEDLTEVIRRFQSRVAEVMAGFGGVVAQRLGDGALVYFGYPHASEDDPERAVRAALAAVRAVSAIEVAAAAGIGPQRLSARVGAATGVAVMGDVAGAGAAGGLDIAGEVANLAARLQAAAEPGTVLVSDALRALAGELFLWRDRGGLPLKGWDEPVRAWEALGPAGIASRSEARQRAAPSCAMIGRDAAAEALDALWRSVAAGGGGRVALVRGEAGIGKSCLVAHLLERARARQHIRLGYFCLPHQREAPLHPFLPHIERFAGFAEADTAEQRRAKLRRAFPAMPEEDRELVAGLLLVPPAPGEGGAAAARRLAQAAPFRRRERTLDALHAALLRLARVEPVLAVVEDAHWADPTSLELLALAAGRIAGTRALLVVTARPGFAPNWAGAPGTERLDLAPLTAAQTEELVRRTAGGVALPGGVVAEILRRSDGVPLYAEELTKSVLEAASARGAGGGVGAEAVPASVQASLLARLDRLDRSAREAAQIASAIGRDFDARLLGRVGGLEEGALAGAMGRLLDSGLVVPAAEGHGGGPYRFKHALIRDAAYGTVVRPRRRELHARIAEALREEELAGGGAPRRPQLLAHHLTEAGLAAEAAAAWLRAGLHSLHQSATTEALAQFRRGLDLIPLLPEGEARARLELDLRIAAGKCLTATLGWAAEETGEAFAAARALCDALGGGAQRRSLLFGQWTRAFLRAELPAARTLAEEILAAAEGAPDAADWRVVGHYCAGPTLHSLGDFAGVRDHVGRGLALFDPARRDAYTGPSVSDPRVVMRSYLAWALLCAGEFDAAWAECERALAEARAAGEPMSLAHAIWRRAYHASFAGGPAEALAGLEELWPVVAEQGLLYYRALGLTMRGWCVGAQGDPAAGLALLREGLEGYGRTGSRLYLPSFWRMEAELLGLAGEGEAGLGRAAEAEALLRRTGEVWDEAEVLRVRGALLAGLGRAEAAEDCLRKALSLAEARGALWFALRAGTSLARLLAERGGEAAAAALLRPLLGRFPGADARSADLREARALLAALGGAVPAKAAALG